MTPNLRPIIIDAELGLVNRVAQLATGVNARNAPYNRLACVAEHDRPSFRRRFLVHGTRPGCRLNAAVRPVGITPLCQPTKKEAPNCLCLPLFSAAFALHWFLDLEVDAPKTRTVGSSHGFRDSYARSRWCLCPSRWRRYPSNPFKDWIFTARSCANPT